MTLGTVPCGDLLLHFFCIVSTAAQSGTNLSYYAQQQLQADAAKQAQQKQIEEELKLEKKRREESALLGLDAYNLECTYFYIPSFINTSYGSATPHLHAAYLNNVADIQYLSRFSHFSFVQNRCASTPSSQHSLQNDIWLGRGGS